MREAIKSKYSLIRYYYTTLHDMSTKGTGTLYKPLFFEFPEDPLATQDVINNVILRSALKLSLNASALNETSTSSFYFPKGTWCRIAGNTNGETCFVSAGEVRQYPSEISDFQLHLREGFIVPMQNTSDGNFSTSVDLQKRPVDFHVLGEPTPGGWRAQGRYVNEDGVSLVSKVISYDLIASSDFQIDHQVISVLILKEIAGPLD